MCTTESSSLSQWKAIVDQEAEDDLKVHNCIADFKTTRHIPFVCRVWWREQGMGLILWKCSIKEKLQCLCPPMWSYSTSLFVRLSTKVSVSPSLVLVARLSPSSVLVARLSPPSVCFMLAFSSLFCIVVLWTEANSQPSSRENRNWCLAKKYYMFYISIHSSGIQDHPTTNLLKGFWRTIKEELTREHKQQQKCSFRALVQFF